MSSPVVHFEVLGSDGAALARFYGELFGWRMREVPGMAYYVVDKEEGGVGGGVGATPGDGPGHVTFYVQVDDPGAALEKAESLGAKAVVPVTSIPQLVTYALFADPEGHVVGLVASAPPE